MYGPCGPDCKLTAKMLDCLNVLTFVPQDQRQPQPRPGGVFPNFTTRVGVISCGAAPTVVGLRGWCHDGPPPPPVVASHAEQQFGDIIDPS